MKQSHRITEREKQMVTAAFDLGVHVGEEKEKKKIISKLLEQRRLDSMQNTFENKGQIEALF